MYPISKMKINLQKGDFMHRSWLFVPGSQDKYLKKVKELKTDVIIFDLEDSVIKAKKDEARVKVSEAISDMRTKVNFVRVNGIYTEFFIDDLEKLVRPGLTGIVLPKVNKRDDMIIADYMLDQIEKKHLLEPKSVTIVPIIESAKALHNAYDIASSCNRVKCLAFGAEDLMLDMNIKSSNGIETLYARSKMIEVSKASSIGPPIDQIYPNLADMEGLRKEAENGRNLGFQGKLLIHPNQVETINEVFTPTIEEINEAKEVIEKYHKSIVEGFGVSKVNGKMIDAPIVEKAKRILDYAERNKTT
ncbi:MAG TPA: CoA ester lyase [Bacillus bacterium]|nr:CoA ester lyase [Bacillus sp. (in: firmicutes)]